MTSSFISSSSTTSYTPLLNPKFNQSSFSFSNPRINFCCFAAKQQQSGPVKKRSTNNNKKPTKNNSNKSKNGSGFNKGFGVNEEQDDYQEEETSTTTSSSKVRYQPLPLPKPPAGFLVDDQGRVVAVSDRRIATIVCFFYQSIIYFQDFN